MRRFLLSIFILLSLQSFAQNSEVAIKLDSGIVADWVEPEKVFDQPDPGLSAGDLQSIAADKQFLKSLPESYDNVSPRDMQNIVKKLDDQLERLTKEKELLLKNNASQEVIDSKTGTIEVIGKEKRLVSLTVDKDRLLKETNVLGTQKEKLKKYLIITAIILAILILFVVVLLQRKTIGVKDKEIESQLDDINKKNNYLEHAARIIRHDMHSGINTYMPRGLSSLEKRVSGEKLKELKIDGSVKMLKEGLAHTQRVYKSVYEFTNLVKPDSVFEIEDSDVKTLLLSYIENTSYTSEVEVSDLTVAKINPYLFCTAIDNLIRNGLKFNDSEKKLVKIFMEGDSLIVEDNGRGLESGEFEKIKKNKSKRGLGLNIAIAILEEHKFPISCKKLPTGTQMKIKIK
jgi:K+-sensing histidine kinase KdpD